MIFILQMDTPIVKELARWTDGFFKTIGFERSD